MFRLLLALMSVTTWLLAFVVVVVVNISALIKGQISTPNYGRVTNAIVALPFLVTALCGIVWIAIAVQTAQVEKDRDRLVWALESYHAQNGRYPYWLSELAPNYIQSVPRLPNGEEYYYSADAYGGFHMSYTEVDGGLFGCEYDSGRAKWICD